MDHCVPSEDPDQASDLVCPSVASVVAASGVNHWIAPQVGE